MGHGAVIWDASVVMIFLYILRYVRNHIYLGYG